MKLFGLMTVIVVNFLCTNLYAQECDQHLQIGVPSEADSMLCREGYAIGYDTSTRSAKWVSYTLTRKQLTSKPKYFGRNFKEDKEIDFEFRVNPKEYIQSGYDKGQLAPSLLLTRTRQEQSETFLMSNVIAQKAGFNRYDDVRFGAWGALEQMEIKWLSKRGELSVIAGPLYLNESTKRSGRLVVPSHFYKAYYDSKLKSTIAFLLPHKEDTAAQLQSYIVTVDCLEKLSTLDFFSELDDEIETDIENKQAYNLTHWAMRDRDSGPSSCVIN